MAYVILKQSEYLSIFSQNLNVSTYFYYESITWSHVNSSDEVGLADTRRRNDRHDAANCRLLKFFVSAT